MKWLPLALVLGGCPAPMTYERCAAICGPLGVQNLWGDGSTERCVCMPRWTQTFSQDFRVQDSGAICTIRCEVEPLARP